MTMTPRRMSLPPLLTNKEGDRIPVPEGGELVCFRNSDGRLALKVVYSREIMVKLSTSIFCHQRSPQLAKVFEENPELLGLPHSISEMCFPLQQQTSPFVSSSAIPASPLRIFSPLRGPVTVADEASRTLSGHREILKRLEAMEFETPSRAIEVRNPRFT